MTSLQLANCSMFVPRRRETLGQLYGGILWPVTQVLFIFVLPAFYVFVAVVMLISVKMLFD